MDDTIGSIAVPERLAVLRTEAPTNPSVLRELADNLLQFSRSLDQHGDMNGAFEAARDGIMALARACYAEDEELTVLMDAHVAQYLSISHRSRLKADRKMLMPIAVALAHAVQP
jgi:hypothetical protein